MNRRADLDLLKGFSIIAIVFYHVGILPFGYLGVDVFLVISGFLIIPSVIEQISNSDFRYFQWIWRRFKRFLPLVTIVCAVSLIIGYFIMMPDDYENLAQSSVASELFANNVLLSITTKNYWASANEYKPLLALWYLGIIAQFFIVFPLIFIFIRKCLNKPSKRILLISLYIITVLSFIFYLLPIFDFNQKFYYLPFRMWEICLGGCAFFIAKKHTINYNFYVYVFLFTILLFIFCISPVSIQDIDNVTIIGVTEKINSHYLIKSLLLILTALVSVTLVLKEYKVPKIFHSIVFFGQMSLSLFIWHQVIIAFMRYSLFDKLTSIWLIFYLILCIVVSTISYKWLEQLRFEKRKSICFLFISWAVVLCISFFIYHRAGVLKDFPEMGVTKANPYAVRNTEYIDRIYSYRKPFITNKKKVLVIGNSFARDFTCCLEEWDKENNLEISYMVSPIKNDERLIQSNYIFFFGDRNDVPQWLWDCIDSDCKVYGIGTKNFGKTFGRTHIKKGSKDYYNSSLPIPPLLKEINDIWKESWGDNFIDFVNASLNEKGEIRVFTPDSMIISFDCQHLTPAGAIYFSSRLGFNKIFNADE